MRRLLLALLLVPALLLPAAGPAAADDLFEIDVRLEDAGFTDAYTEAYDAVSGEGIRVSVDFSSASSTRAEYEQEARDAAEVLWQHLEGRLLAVDVVPTADVPWTPDGLPPAVSFVRADLQTAFGPRPQGLDDGDVYGEEELPFGEEELVADTGVVVLVALVLLLVVVAVVVAVVVLVRRRHPRQPEWGAWPSPGAWPAGGPAPGWQQPGGWPQQGWPQQDWPQQGASPREGLGPQASAQQQAAQPAQHVSPPASGDPWAPPPGA